MLRIRLIAGATHLKWGTTPPSEGDGSKVRCFNTSARPPEITLDTVQFYYASLLWNFFDPSQPGFDPENRQNVEWTGWTNDTAAMVAWRNWGSQFRMPTPQPNLASPALLAQTKAAPPPAPSDPRPAVCAHALLQASCS